VLVFEFDIVKSLEVPLGTLEPSIITKSLPFNLMIELVEEPEIEGVAPSAGLIVIVFVALAPVIELIVIGKVSVPLLYVDRRLSVTGPDMPQVAKSDIALVKLG
jgi:hypothetical protein